MILERPGYRRGAWGLRQAMVLLRQPLRKLSIMAVIIFSGARSGAAECVGPLKISGQVENAMMWSSN